MSSRSFGGWIFFREPEALEYLLASLLMSGTANYLYLFSQQCGSAAHAYVLD